jgi:biopolymer transport protein ExbB
VPAVLGYNVLLRRNKSVQERVTHFAHELHAFTLSGAKLGLGRDNTAPAAGKPATAAAR